MPSTRHLLSLALGLTCAAPALAQNAFRPLPSIPESAAWSGAFRPMPPARGYMEELEYAADLPRPRSFFELRAFADGSGSTALDGGGDVSSQRGGWQVLFGSQLDERRLAALALSTEAYFYNFGGATTLVPGENEPFNDLYRAALSGIVRTPPEPGVGWFAGFELALSGEDEASASESMTVGGLGGLRYHVSDELDFEVGIAALSRLEDTPWIWPFLGLNWQATESLRFEARGTSLEGRVALGDAWSLFGRAEYQLRQFRLNEDNPLPNGVFRDEEIRAGLGLSRRSANGFEFELFGGFNVWRELSTLDEDGDDVSELEADATPFVALTLKLSV